MLKGAVRPFVTLVFIIGWTGCDSNSASVCGAGALLTTDLIIGTGQTAMQANAVRVDYEGRLENGQIFDDGMDAIFELNGVIRGFRDGIVGMRVGGRREIVIPPDLAYGQAGVPGRIPPCETLTFTVDLLAIQQ